MIHLLHTILRPGLQTGRSMLMGQCVSLPLVQLIMVMCTQSRMTATCTASTQTPEISCGSTGVLLQPERDSQARGCAQAGRRAAVQFYMMTRSISLLEYGLSWVSSSTNLTQTQAQLTGSMTGVEPSGWISRTMMLQHLVHLLRRGILQLWIMT